MVKCSNPKCRFTTKYPGKKICWQLNQPLCGDCAYELDTKLNKILVQIGNKIEKSLIPTLAKYHQVIEKRDIFEPEVVPVLLAFKKNPNFKLYKKMYVRKPSTKGGRFSQKNLNAGTLSISME